MHEANVPKAIKEVYDTWNAWADCVEKLFQQVGDQMEDLEISEDEYITFVHMLASHPARPARRPLEDLTEHEDWFKRTMPLRYLTYLDGLWNKYADELEKTYVGIAVELGRCDLLTSPFETTSTRGQLHGILRSMLGPGRPFRGLAGARAREVVAGSATHVDQLVSRIERMDLHGAPATNMGITEEVMVKLEKMSIEAGISRVEYDWP